jgi:hypothetical protein
MHVHSLASPKRKKQGMKRAAAHNDSAQWKRWDPSYLEGYTSALYARVSHFLHPCIQHALFGTFSAASAGST